MSAEIDNDVTPGIYRHFKNHQYYLVFGVSTQTETGERFVTYMALYGDHALFSRPLAMFQEIATNKEGHQAKRFELVRPAPDLTDFLIKCFPSPE